MIRKRQIDYYNRPGIKEQIQKYYNEWELKNINENPEFRFKKNLRNNIRQAIKRYSKNGKVRSCQEYDIDFVAIFNKIGPKPSNEYELDHIIPISVFDLDNKAHVRLAHLPCNMRWITSTENKSKGNKIPKIAYVDNELRELLIQIGILEITNNCEHY